MKIKEVHYTSPETEWTYREGLSIEINGEKAVSFLDGEPEDAILGRDFSDVYSISNLLEMAYKAGLDGEHFDFETVDTDDIEEL